jgi:hypothetical protein
VAAVLAVYMHGISKEILKLVRASAALHAIGDRTARADASAADHFDPKDPEFDTEPVYFDLLREIGRKLDLRVIVDIVAGASAASTARCSRAPEPTCRSRGSATYVENADVEVLLSSQQRGGGAASPVIWAAAKTGTFRAITDMEVRKLSLFVRSRWFRPPLDGRVAGLMYDAVARWARSTRVAASPGHPLDLFVTLTDYYMSSRKLTRR